MTPPDILDHLSGRIEVITGGMFSGKSEELVRRLRRALIARQNVQVFKPVLDDRHPAQRLITRNRQELSAISVENIAELRTLIEDDVAVLGIDEAQFFSCELAELAMHLADRGIRVIIAGLDLDYRRQAFGPMPEILAIAEYVDKLHAVCISCGGPAHYSQRISGGSAQVEVGDLEAYEARCRTCYEPYGASS